MDPEDFECRAGDLPVRTPIAHARADGTYNPETNRFCCDDCYIRRGCPTAPPPRGWKAP